MITTIPMNIGSFTLSPDGKRAAFIAAVVEPVNSYTQSDLWTLELTENAKPVNLTTDFDYDAGDSVFGDKRAYGCNVSFGEGPEEAANNFGVGMVLHQSTRAFAKCESARRTFSSIGASAGNSARATASTASACV